MMDIVQAERRGQRAMVLDRPEGVKDRYGGSHSSGIKV
jgi:hypothetical protein